MTFSALARDYLRSKAAVGRQAARTGENYDETFGLFVEFLHGQGRQDDVREFTPENVAAFRDWLTAGRKGSSVSNRLSALSSLGQWATKTERPKATRLAINPASPDFVERPKKEHPREKFLYREELAALRAVSCDPCERLALDLFLDTGLRVNELASATVRCLTLEARPASLGAARIDDQPPGATPAGVVLSVRLKGGRQSPPIPLDPDLGARLEVTLRQREVKPDDPLLVNTRGDAYKRNTLTEMVYRLACRAGITRIPVRPHVLRHTYSVFARQAGLDTVQRASLLNHSDTSTIHRYDHLMPGEAVSARSRVREAMR
jgi:integrase/recombinase XerD